MAPSTIVQKLATANEQAWLTLGNLAELMSDWEKAIQAYESALRHNPYSIRALTQIASLCRGREQFSQAVDYFKRILAIQENNGETWGSLGHCYLMMDHLQEAYHAYQQALYHLPNPKDPKLWYGIGILYDRYGSIEHAEEAFSAVTKMDPQFEKTNEIYFRLGIIYKQQQKYDLSLQCFQYILARPPRPLTEVDIWFQQGHVYEQQKEYEKAKEAYERVLTENPDHSKVLQQLGWLHHQQNTSFTNQTMAIQYLTRSLKADSQDAQSWYLLGRCYMTEQNYSKAYEAYQQAVYRDARNPTFWCSIGVLYYQINQYRDALDAYSRAIRLNPYISEVWYDLGTLYESCNNQIQDALDAYQRASELDPKNPHIRQRLDLLKRTHGVSSAMTTPVPQDVDNPYQYNNSNDTNTSSFDSSLSHQQHHQQQQQHQQHQQQQQLSSHPPPHSPPALLHQPNTSLFQRYDRPLVSPNTENLPRDLPIPSMTNSSSSTTTTNTSHHPQQPQHHSNKPLPPARPLTPTLAGIGTGKAPMPPLDERMNPIKQEQQDPHSHHPHHHHHPPPATSSSASSGAVSPAHMNYRPPTLRRTSILFDEPNGNANGHSKPPSLPHHSLPPPPTGPRHPPPPYPSQKRSSHSPPTPNEKKKQKLASIQI